VSFVTQSSQIFAFKILHETRTFSYGTCLSNKDDTRYFLQSPFGGVSDEAVNAMKNQVEN